MKYKGVICRGAGELEFPFRQAIAKAQGFRWAYYPWICNDRGEDITSGHYRNEIHNNSSIGLSAWKAAGTPADKAFLEDTSHPILEGVADFLVSRAVRDPVGSWRLRCVMPPDESVAECHHAGTGDDSVLANVGARTVLRWGVEAARLLGRPAPPEWTEVADKLVVLAPGPDVVIPEYAECSGHVIKLADTVGFLSPRTGSRSGNFDED